MSGVKGNLERRQALVLEAIVRQHVATSLPVGSKAVAIQFADPVSSATVRNIMADLEAAGYLTHPHTSAGRVPTGKAYRLFVDSLRELPPLGQATERYIDETLGTVVGSPQRLMERASRILAEVSRNLGVVLGPPLEEKLLEHIKFVKLADQRVLAVIVSQPELIENKVIRLEEEFQQEELDQAADFLNGEFQGWSLRTIRLELVKRIEDMKAACDRLLTNVALLFMWGALAEEGAGPLYVGGATKILDQREFLEDGQVKDLLAAIEEKAKLVEILSACVENTDLGVQVLIGDENPKPEMRRCAFILAPYRYRDHPVGALGVIGPTRMEYDRAMTTVDYVSRLTSRLLSSA